MPVARVKELLDKHGIKYVCMLHSPAYTAPEVAAAAHIPGSELAKTVMVKLDDQMAMAVLPASEHIDFDLLAEEADCDEASLAGEAEFQDLFPDCEVGAMPPFGNLWDLPVYVSETLADESHIAFSAGSHTEVMSLSFDDFRRMVEPRIMDFSMR